MKAEKPKPCFDLIIFAIPNIWVKGGDVWLQNTEKMATFRRKLQWKNLSFIVSLFTTNPKQTDLELNSDLQIRLYLTAWATTHITLTERLYFSNHCNHST
jgi:hypothetical protein